MVSSPKDQEQGNNTEKQANPISIHNQLDYCHKQQSATRSTTPFIQRPPEA